MLPPHEKRFARRSRTDLTCMPTSLQLLGGVQDHQACMRLGLQPQNPAETFHSAATGTKLIALLHLALAAQIWTDF